MALPKEEHKDVMLVFRPKEGKKEEFLKAAKKMVEESRKEPGCVQFNMFAQDMDSEDYDGNSFMMVDIWKDNEAWKAHQHTPHFKEFYKAWVDEFSGTVEAKEIKINE